MDFMDITIIRSVNIENTYLDTVGVNKMKDNIILRAKLITRYKLC
jgi:hypothetical protein